MSKMSEEVRKAIYSKLNVLSVTSKASNGVHFMVAPDGTSAPFVVFSRVPAQVVYGLNNNLVVENDLWLIKAVTDKDSSFVKSPIELAEQILTACETAIGGTLTLATKQCLMARRVSEIPNYLEQKADSIIYHHGFMLSVYAQ